MYKLLSKSKILVIDDFAGFRQTIKTMLQRLGAHHIDQSSNGSEAVKSCENENYDIIFCDYNLGDGQDGQQILEELHQRSLMEMGTLFLMVTAETTTAQVMGAIEYRPDAYLTKPFTNEQLGQRLKRLLLKNAALDSIYSAVNAGETEKAISLCDATMNETPKLKFSCLRIKSDLLEQNKQFEEAMVIFRDVVEEQPVLWAMLGIGRLSFLQGDVAGALEHFQDMRETFPRQVSVLDWVARCQTELGEAENAEQTLKEAVSISPKSVSRQANLGEVAASLNNHELAQKAFAKTIHEGNYSCMLKPQHFEQYYDNTREVVQALSPREKSRILAESDHIYKKMQRVYQKNPAALATNMGSVASLYSAAGQEEKSSEVLSKLVKTLNNPDCKITKKQVDSISEGIKNLDGDKSLNLITTRLNQVKDELGEKQKDSDKATDKIMLAKKKNAEGMLLAKQGKSLDALFKFREAMELSPENYNFMLNAAQIIVESDELNISPDRREEAKTYLHDKILIDKSDIRWKRYQKLVSRISHDRNFSI